MSQSVDNVQCPGGLFIFGENLGKTVGIFRDNRGKLSKNQESLKIFKDLYKIKKQTKYAMGNWLRIRNFQETDLSLKSDLPW